MSSPPFVPTVTPLSSTSTPPAMAVKTPRPKEEKPKKAKMHRRSRSGCFTCRLRRKKCEEGRPSCKACRQLGLTCDYKRPLWWSSVQDRRLQKEHIKDRIKHTQLAKKSCQSPPTFALPDPNPLPDSCVYPFHLDLDLNLGLHLGLPPDDDLPAPWIHHECHDSWSASWSAFPPDADADASALDALLLTHFHAHILPLLFPAIADPAPLVLPSLASNPPYRHCSLSTAAAHLAAHPTPHSPALPALHTAIIHHRVAAIQSLCAALTASPAAALDATLAMILFPTAVDRVDAAADIPWPDHFLPATNLIHSLDLPDQSPAFALAARIDILAAPLRAQPPVFADVYREHHTSRRALGLAALTACADPVLFLISEAACLDAQRAANALDPLTLCTYIECLAAQLDATEAEQPTQPPSPSSTSTPSPSPSPEPTLTPLFRLAARIYLCTLVPDFDRASPSLRHLVRRFAAAWAPLDAGRWDAALLWPLLLAGRVSLPGDEWRLVWDARVGDASAGHAGLRRLARLLGLMWAAAGGDGGLEGGEGEALAGPGVGWREVGGGEGELVI